jgi:curved DNA-binding protein
MEYTDYYKVLGVARDAKQPEIKRAYRKLARQYHPDVSDDKDASTKFKEVGEAYAVLKDPEKRAAYDQLGANWKAGQDFRPPPGWDAGFEYRGGFDPGGFDPGGGTGGVDPSQFSDFFETLFGGRRGGGPGGARGAPFRARGGDHHAKILIDLEDAYSGATRALTLRGAELTDDGRVTTNERTLNVRIPKGIRQGQQIRLAGQGEPGIGGSEAGDLYLEIEFNPHRHYRVEGADVHMELPVAPWEAALGASITVPTPFGAVGLKVPPGSYQGRTLRLKGRGIPAKTPGDLYVALQVVLPPADTDEARKAYEAMKDLDFDPRPGLGV